MDELLEVLEGLSLAQKAGFACLGMVFLVIGGSMISLLCGDKRKTPTYIGPKNPKGRAHGTGKYACVIVFVSIDRTHFTVEQYDDPCLAQVAGTKWGSL